LKSGRYLGCVAGQLAVLDSDTGVNETLDAAEQRAVDFANSTVERWTPNASVDPAGACRDCRFFLGIESDFALRDWGVCACPGGPHDGLAVSVEGGCRSFEAR
jgi:hypothetical protein